MEWGAYPVPHCSTFVMFNWRRLLSHASSSCLLFDELAEYSKQANVQKIDLDVV